MSNHQRSVHVATITKRQGGKTQVTHLLRHTYRENGKVSRDVVIRTDGVGIQESVASRIGFSFIEPYFTVKLDQSLAG